MLWRYFLHFHQHMSIWQVPAVLGGGVEGGQAAHGVHEPFEVGGGEEPGALDEGVECHEV